MSLYFSQSFFCFSSCIFPLSLHEMETKAVESVNCTMAVRVVRFTIQGGQFLSVKVSKLPSFMRTFSFAYTANSIRPLRHVWYLDRILASTLLGRKFTVYFRLLTKLNPHTKIWLKDLDCAPHLPEW